MSNFHALNITSSSRGGVPHLPWYGWVWLALVVGAPIALGLYAVIGRLMGW